MGRAADDPPPALDATAYAFLGATCLSVIGTAFGLLGATGATTAAGGIARGGLYTGIYMASTILATALATPYGPLVCARSGVRRAFAATQAVNALAYLVAGIALLAGVPTMPTLLLAAPVFGATAGMSGVVRPLVSKSYQSSSSTAHSYARLSVALGLAWGFGGLVGGLTLGVASAVFLAPIMGLVVPVAQDLRQIPAVGAAGLLIASFALGEIAAPWAVRFAQRRSTDLRAGSARGPGGAPSLRRQREPERGLRAAARERRVRDRIESVLAPRLAAAGRRDRAPQAVGARPAIGLGRHTGQRTRQNS